MNLLKKMLNRETTMYLIFGVATTLVNYIVFFLTYNEKNSLLANAMAFVAAVVFAYVANKIFVFESKSWSPAVLKEEIPAFLASRIGSFLVEEAGLFVCESVLHLGGVVVFTVAGRSFDGIAVAKFSLSIIVVILNYVFCKLVVFKKLEKSS